MHTQPSTTPMPRSAASFEQLPIALVRAIRVVADLGVLSAALWLAYALRFDWIIPAASLRQLLAAWPWVVGLQYLILHLFGVPSFSWRYAGLREVTRIFLALLVGSLLVFGLGLLAELPWMSPGSGRIPRGVLLSDFLLALVGITGIRALRRIATERRPAAASTKKLRTLILGAGQAGLQVAREVGRNGGHAIEPVGFVDDDPAKHGVRIHGIRVVGPVAELAALKSATRAQQALIAIAGLTGEQARRIHQACRDAELPVKIIPTLQELVGGQINLRQVRDVSIEDLLRRDPVVLDAAPVRAAITGKTVCVTGAGGSIGSELCRQVAACSPAALLLIEQAENALFWLHRELAERWPDLRILPCIADVCDAERMEQLFRQHRPAMIFHAAAHKHVPLMEANPGEAIKNNVLGTRIVADLADRYGAERFVLISTDKAVNPTSVMGASKRVAELYVQALAQQSATKLACVRFGNVLGSAGSVIPIFREQIERGGPVTVTHPEMQRYFMTIPEACQLVLQAGSIGEGGEIFVLDMGEPVRILDVARDMIRLSGLRPDVDIEIRHTGLRPGEKLFEELSVVGEETMPTRCPKVFIWRSPPRTFEAMAAGLDALFGRTNGSSKHVREALHDLVPEYTVERLRPAASEPAVGLLGVK